MRKASDATKVRTLRRALRMLLATAEGVLCATEREQSDLRYVCDTARSWADMPRAAREKEESRG